MQFNEQHIQYLQKVYHDTQVQANPGNHDPLVCLTYGELLYFSVQGLLKKIGPAPDDIFLDLGSGLGKCAVQVFLESVCQKVVGIEASDELFVQAQRVRQLLQQDFPKLWQQKNLEFIQGNFIETDWQQATIVYSCSTCFTQELLLAIGNKANQNQQIKQLLSLRPIPNLQNLTLKQVFGVECSWDSALCFHYTQ